jgi:rhodanese-related sulfurtransferase
MIDITVEELKTRMDLKEPLNIIDVREQHEYEEFNIGARLIPLSTLPDMLGELDELKDEELIIHCRSGNRSGTAKAFLAQAGFTKVRNLLGGMLEWQSKFKS